MNCPACKEIGNPKSNQKNQKDKKQHIKAKPCSKRLLNFTNYYHLYKIKCKNTRNFRELSTEIKMVEKKFEALFESSGQVNEWTSKMETGGRTGTSFVQSIFFGVPSY